MIDPQERWAQYGEKPDFAGLLTFSGTVYTEDPEELEGFDVAIVGARSAPPAARPARTWRPRSTPSPICGSSTSATPRSSPRTR